MTKPTSIVYLLWHRGETMRSLLALQIPEHVAGGSASGYHLTHHHVPIDGGGALAAVGNEYMESEVDLDKKRDKLRQPPSMWSRPKVVGINTNEKHKSSLKKPIPKGGAGRTDFSIAV